MGNVLLPLLTFLVLIICQLVESRHCTYLTSDGYVRTIFCSSYEYCCGNACCRPAAFTFYQFWYFWLSVILIMLLCSGGSWWYRFRYRNQLMSQSSAFAVTTTGVSQPRTNTGAVYYPGADRVYLQTQPKDPYMRTALGPQMPDYAYQGAYPGMGMQPPPPPPYGSGPPPSYDSIIAPTPYSPSPSTNPPTMSNPPYPVQPMPPMYPPPPVGPSPAPTNANPQEMDANLRNRYGNEPAS